MANHSDKCLAHACINAVENLRDSDNLEWTLATHGYNILGIALDYLWTGTVTCICE